MDDWLVTLQRAKTTPPWPGRPSALLLAHGTMTLRFYKPTGRDTQMPHDQDQIYIVATGSGTVATGPSETTLQLRRFNPGDAIFVPAGHVHHFRDFSSDFATWMMLWGRKGGEA